MNPFDFVNSINTSKKDLMTGSENDAAVEKAYVPFLVNRALSYFPDTVFHANVMNVHCNLDNKPQFHYHLNSIRPSKRFSKWAKREDGDLQLVMEYFQYGINKAKQVLPLLSAEQLSMIKTTLHSGVDNDGVTR